MAMAPQPMASKGRLLGEARIYPYNWPPYHLSISFNNHLDFFPILVNAFAFCFP